MKKSNEKRIVQVKCVDITFDGQGLAKDDNNRTYFVPSLLKGEEALVEVLYTKKDYDIAKINKIITFSKDRIKPLCPCATSCGGCSFQNLSYEAELNYKKEAAIKTLNNIAKLDIKDAPVHHLDSPYYYRNKIQIPFGYDKQKRLVYGFYKFKSHDIVPIKECVIEMKEHVSILKNIKELMESMKIDAYNEDTGRGILRHVLIRVGKASKEIMVVFIVTSLSFYSKKNFVKELIKREPGITTIVFNQNSRKTNVILGDKEEISYGPGFIYDSLLGVKFKISSKSFYQVNHDGCELLYSLAIKKAGLKKEDTILDAYCGIGTIGLIASSHVKEVDGVEIVKEAIVDAKNNAKINKINNANFVCEDAKDYMLNKKYDVIFVDPPRKGLEAAFLDALMKSKTSRIIYISCDVGTLARDLGILKKAYKIESIDFVDMFPRTYHIETVASLRLR